MRFCNTLTEYEAAKANGTVTDDTLVIVLEDKVAKFKGQTFDWSGGGSDIDISSLATKAEVIDNEEVTAGAFAELNARTAAIEEAIQNDLVSNEQLEMAAEEFNEETINNEEATAAALSDLNKRVASLFTDLVNQYAKKLDTDRAAENTRAEMLSNEEVTAYGFAVIYRELEEIKKRIYLLETR